MEYRDKVVEELFKLRIALNRSNPKNDQRTELKFKIQKSLKMELRAEFVACLEGIKNPAFLVLSYKRVDIWVEPNSNQFPYLAEFCTKKLNRLSKNKEDTNIVEQIQNQLRTLGIKK